MKAVNVSLTVRNWLIGFYIVEFELNGDDRAKYGENLFPELAEKFKHVKGIDKRSLYRFKDFYKLYPHLQSEITPLTHFLSNNDSNAIVGIASPQFEALEKAGKACINSKNKPYVRQCIQRLVN